MICSSGRSTTSMVMSLECQKANRRSGNRNGVRAPFRFRRGLSGRQAFVLLGFGANRNETGIFRGVTGKPSGLAPPNTVYRRKDPLFFNGLDVSQNRPETVFSAKPRTIYTARTDHNLPAPHAHNTEHSVFIPLENFSVLPLGVSPKNVSQTRKGLTDA